MDPVMSVFSFLLDSRVSTHLLSVMIVFINFFPGRVLSADVTLESVEILKTHEWFEAKPTVYFMCKGENKTVLPDVKKAQVAYTFKGEESWQPLVELSNKKCKRCGFYEEDLIETDDVFDEWEFCPSDFTASDAKYRRSKDKEFTAIFSCPRCIPISEASNHAPSSHNGVNGMHLLIVILISVLVSTVVILGMMTMYKYWLKKKRAKEQAQFLKLFEDGDDIEDELGLGNMI